MTCRQALGTPHQCCCTRSEPTSSSPGGLHVVPWDVFGYSEAEWRALVDGAAPGSVIWLEDRRPSFWSRLWSKISERSK